MLLGFKPPQRRRDLKPKLGFCRRAWLLWSNRVVLGLNAIWCHGLTGSAGPYRDLLEPRVERRKPLKVALRPGALPHRLFRRSGASS